MSESEDYSNKKKQKKKGDDKRKPIKKKGIKSLTEKIKESTMRMASSDEESFGGVTSKQVENKKRGRPRKIIP